MKRTPFPEVGEQTVPQTGQHRHDAGKWRRYVKCSHCGQIVNVGPTNRLRKHYKSPLREPSNECHMGGDLATNHEVA